MRLTPPKKNVWWVAVVLTAISLIGQFVALPLIGGFEYWLAFVGALLLILGASLKGF